MSKDEAMKEVLSADELRLNIYTKFKRTQVGKQLNETLLSVLVDIAEVEAKSYAQYREQLYLKSKLNEVTDEMIENYSKSKEVHETEYMDALSEGRNDGAKWLLKHLKRTES